MNSRIATSIVAAQRAQRRAERKEVIALMLKELVWIALLIATIVAIGKLVKVESENSDLEREVQRLHDQRVAMERNNGYVYEREVE